MATRSTPITRARKAVPDQNGKAGVEEADEKLVDSAPIQLERVSRHYVLIPIKGTAPLIVNRFSEKAKGQMEDSQRGKSRMRQPKNPQVDYEAARYKMPGAKKGEVRDGFPASGYKAATVGGARYFQDKRLTMTLLKQALGVIGTEVEIEGKMELLVPIVGEPSMRRDPVRNATGVADLRYRPEYWPWEAVLRVEFIPNVLSVESVINLVDAGGIGGIGEWRPASKKSMTGQYGTYEVVFPVEAVSRPLSAR